MDSSVNYSYSTSTSTVVSRKYVYFLIHVEITHIPVVVPGTVQYWINAYGEWRGMGYESCDVTSLPMTPQTPQTSKIASVPSVIFGRLRSIPFSDTNF